MDTLNDDCQLLIIEYLNLEDQLALYAATKEEPTNRWISNVRYYWQHQESFSLDSDHFQLFTEKPELLDDFLSCVSSTVQQLDLQLVTLDKLKGWRHYSFSKMRSLEYSMDDDDAECNGDLFKLTSELFPELTHFKPYGVFNCVHFKNWMCLRKLDLSECWSISGIHDEENGFAKEIAELKMLEELIIENHIFEEGFYSMLMSLPKFRKLTYHMGCKHDGFSGTRILDIDKITFNDSIWSINLHTLQSIKNLRQLTLLGADGFTNKKLQELVMALPRLERLDLIDFSLSRSEIELWKTVDCCPFLKILNISSTRLDVDYFDISRRPMENVLNKRSTPLTLHCHDIGKCEHLIRSYFRHPKLKVSFEPLKINYIDSNCVQLNFLPLCNVK